MKSKLVILISIITLMTGTSIYLLIKINIQQNQINWLMQTVDDHEDLLSKTDDDLETTFKDDSQKKFRYLKDKTDNIDSRIDLQSQEIDDLKNQTDLLELEIFTLRQYTNQ